MTNFSSVLKSEIARVARKEARAEIESLKKASTQHRSAIAQLRRELAELQKQLRQTARQAVVASKATATAVAASDARKPPRFSAGWLAAHRAKLGISAAAYGTLVGIGGQTIYNWEKNIGQPNAEQKRRLAAVRAMSKREVLEQLAAR